MRAQTGEETEESEESEKPGDLAMPERPARSDSETRRVKTRRSGETPERGERAEYKGEARKPPALREPDPKTE